MRILVAGGTGFIGSNLCEKLINQGHYVICLDNNSTGSMDNIKHLRSNLNFEFIRHDITNPINLEIDQIYHLACPASPKAYQENAIKTIKTNVLGTLNLLGLAKRTKSKFLFTSTSEVYGDPKIHPQIESYWGNVNPIGIRSCYDEGKRLAEAAIYEYNRIHKIDVKIARIFNTYGPKMNPNDGRVISNFINQALNNKPITIYGDGNQTRTFCYIDDLIKGLLLQMESNYKKPINLGGDQEVKILNLAKTIRDKINPKINVVFSNLPEDDPFRRKPNLETAKNVLNWEPIVNLNDGLDITIDKLKGNL